MLRPLLVLPLLGLPLIAAAATALPTVTVPKISTLTSPGAITVGCPFHTADAQHNNSGYLDTYATYGVAQIPLSLPDGASIRIEGVFPKIRYFSLQSYNGAKSGNFVDTVPDSIVVPVSNDPIGTNPADLPLAASSGASFVLKLRYADPPTDPALREPNALYVGAPEFTTIKRVSRQVMYRVYLADAGADLLGDAPMPRLIYSDANGDIEFNNTPDTAKCDRINALADNSFTVSAGALGPRKIVFVPANNAQGSGIYPNGDANYLRSSSSTTYAPIVVIRSKQFFTPPLARPAGLPADVRYWSFCHYGPGKGNVIACLADRDLVVGADGSSTIVLSSVANRPKLATAENGYNWLDTVGDANEEYVIRQLLARPGFAGDYALAEAQPNAPVENSLGEWAPRVTYCTPAAFAAYAASGGAALFDGCYADFYKPLPGGISIPTLPRF